MAGGSGRRRETRVSGRGQGYAFPISVPLFSSGLYYTLLHGRVGESKREELRKKMQSKIKLASTLQGLQAEPGGMGPYDGSRGVGPYDGSRMMDPV